jgi:alpha-amylase/alpha-mannosidase (GH57 family)
MVPATAKRIWTVLGMVLSAGCGSREFPVYRHELPRVSELPATDPDAGVLPADPETRIEEAGGTPDTEVDAAPAPDTLKPELRSAFSRTQGVITARFSEALDPATAAKLASYAIKASNNQALAVASATPDAAAPQYVDLGVDAAAINPALTYTLTVTGVADLAGNPIATGKNKAKVTRTLYLSVIWHQHQPLYLDPIEDQLTGPWVRKHATKDYYDMAAMLAEYPDIHVNVNLTSVLLRQLLEYYVDRLGPFVDVKKNSIDVEGFQASYQGRTDPYLDFMLAPTPTAETISEEELLLVWKGPWTLLSTADPSMKHFPEYQELRDANRAEYDQEDFLRLKIWFSIAWFDPDFLNGPVTFPDGSVSRVHQWLVRTGDTYGLAVAPTEALARDLVVEELKVMKNVVPIHQALFYDAEARTGQIEVTTTPMYHPILPLLFSTELAAEGQPFDPRPDPPFARPDDAKAQVLRAVRYYQDLFGQKPRGIWCGEGSVAEAIVPILVEAGFEWTATDHDVLKRTTGDGGAAEYYGYQIDSDTDAGPGADPNDAMLILFRQTELSDRLGFLYKTWKGTDAAQDFLDDVSALAPSLGGEDRLVTVILDGENAWEQYTQEHDAKGFLHAFYAKLSEAYATGEVVTLTASEYRHGNPARAISPHPVADHTELEPLAAGSWIGGTFSTWIGETEENKAWGYLRKARGDLAASGLAAPNPLATAPAPEAGWLYEVYHAYDSIYAAEGSDWFWWYGIDQTTPSNDDSPFDRAFRSQLLGMYQHLNLALQKLGKALIPVPDFAPLIQAKPKFLEGPYGGPLPAPVIDGAFLPNETEWSPPGGFFFDSDSSTAISATDDLITVYYGYDEAAFYVGVQAAEVLSAKLGSAYGVSVLVDHKSIVDAATGKTQSDPAHAFLPPGEAEGGFAVARRARVDFSGSTAKLLLEASDAKGGWTTVGTHGATLGGPVLGGMILELRLPFADLHLKGPSDPLSFYVVASEGGVDIDAAPSLDSKRVFDDVTNLVFVTFACDATGKEIPLNTLGLKGLPQPDGPGNVYIAGNHDKLGAWLPNKIALFDSGKLGDATAGDRVWSVTLGFPRGEVLQYKYTVGTGTDEGQWPGTEEFSFSNRQYVVPKDPGVGSVLISDVLGDDPPNENSLGKLTKVTEKP